MTNHITSGNHIGRRELLSAAAGSACLSVAGCLVSNNSRRSDSTPGHGSTTSPSGTDHLREDIGAETFEQLAGLGVVGGQLHANTDRNVTGTQCAELHTGSNGAWLHIPLAEPMDFTNARLACYMAADGTAAGKFPYLDLRDVNGNRFRMRSVIRSHDQLVRVDFGVTNPEVDGTAVDLERIDRVTFRPGPTSESGTEVLYLDSPTRVPAPDTAKVVFMFDDGNETDYTEGLPYLSQYGYPAITYVNTDTIGDDGRLDEAQLQELKSEGWLVGSHTTDHTDLSELTDTNTIEQKVRDAKEWLLDRGFTEGARHFAYPYNRLDTQALDIVSQYHDTGRVKSWQPVALPSNPQLIPGDGEVGLSTARELLNQAVKFGGVICLYYHNLASEGSRQHFQEVVDEVRKRERVGDVDVVRLDNLETMVSETTV